MELVVDANILVAGFLRAGTTRELLLDDRLTLCAPEYGLLETQETLLKPRIQRKFGNFSTEEIRLALAATMQNIQVIPDDDFISTLPEAKKLALDPEDAPYLALAIHLDRPLWSHDVILKQQNRVVVYTTQEVLDRL